MGLKNQIEVKKRQKKLKTRIKPQFGCYTLTTARGARKAGACAQSLRFSAQNYGGDVVRRDRIGL
jgi:hypothetical protein